MIGIIDYGLGNLTSVKNALDKLRVPNFISDDPIQLKKSKGLILPGVGAAGAGMKNLKAKGLDQFLAGEIKNGKPFLGICLGMQLLFELSEERNTKCLGILPGAVKKFKGSLKIPEMGWNNVRVSNSKSRILQGIKNESTHDLTVGVSSLDRTSSDFGKPATLQSGFHRDKNYFYFVNSFYCEPDQKEIIAGTTEYGIIFASVIEKDNIFATQFHCEKSGEAGLLVLKNFTEVCK